jgi:aminoglycoside 3-N-acetyltransferase
MKSQVQLDSGVNHSEFIYSDGKLIFFRNSILKRRIKLVQLADIIINDMKITRNDIVMVHASLDNINLVDFKPEDLIYLLKMIIGIGGTLLMPAFQETQNKVPVSKLPHAICKGFSRYELINELFSQMPDTILSPCPAGTLAVWGRMAKNISEENNIIEKENDKDNFFGKLCQMNAKIIGIGTPVSDLTLFYTEGGSKIFDEYELKVFKKRGIPFFLGNSEKVYKKTIVV